MDHNEAVEQMIAERYLLDELTPDAREVFEEHLFDCPECALDLRAGAAFVREAKAQLPELTSASPAPVSSRSRGFRARWDWWLSWLQPAFAA
ncbi:MAG: zf-HC2 domain-containing protein, partial [Terracidiphilus sp.]